MRTFICASVIVSAACAFVGCSTSTSPTGGGVVGPENCGQPATLSANASATPLEHRAYVVSRDSDDLTVIDLDRLEILGGMKTCGEGDHMAELNADFSKIYVDSPGTHETIVVDARTLQITKRMNLGLETTHISLSKDGKMLGVVNEYDDTVSFIDPVKDVEIKRLGGFFTPHFVRWAPDG